MAIKNLNAAPNVGYVKLLKAIIYHREGYQWMTTSSYWLEIIDLALIMEGNSEVIEECIIFIVKLLEESILLNRNFASTVVYSLISPILKVSAGIQKAFDEEEFLNQHFRRIQFLGELFETVLITKNIILCEFLTQFFAKYNFLEKHCVHISLNLTNLDGYFEILNLSSMLHFIDLVSQIKGAQIIKYKEYFSLVSKIKRASKNIVWNQAIFIFPKILHNLIRVDYKMGSYFPKIEMNDKMIDLSDQLIYEQLSGGI